MKKYLALTYEGYADTNIGDYIQSLAAMQYYDAWEYFNRDELGNYHGDSVKAILNGWYTHKPENWPPSSAIDPLFVAFHINSTSYETILSEKSVSYLKNYEPIGCRDENSVEKLREKGVEAYFSSCLTTTLGYKYGKKQPRKGIYIVDPVHFIPEANRRFQKYLLLINGVRFASGIRRYICSLKQENNYELKFNSKGFDRLLQIIRSYTIVRQLLTPRQLRTAKIMTQYHYASEYPTREARFGRAKTLLDLYSSAELVITSRIHCALPCLGLETPVVFLQNMDDSEESTCRFAGLLNLLNVIKFRRNKIAYSPMNLPLTISHVKNSSEYKKYAKALKEKCLAFVGRL